MKKIGMMIIGVLFAFTQMVQAQQPQRAAQMHRYFQQTLIPFIEQQQAQFEKVLTPSEKSELLQIREEMATYRKQGAQMRQAMQGNFNQAAWDARKAQFDAIVAKARKIVEAHPKAAAAYKNAVEKKIAEIKQQMPMAGAMMAGRTGGQGPGMGNRMSKLDRLSDPAVGLVMDLKAMQGMMRNHPQGMMRMNGGQGMRGMRNPQQGMFGSAGMFGPQRMGGMQGNFRQGFSGGMKQHMMMIMRNPEVKKQIMAYKEKNILPVIARQRAAFDKVLSKKERKIIAEARTQMKSQREEMLAMRKQGQRPDDSARLAMQVAMQKERLAVQEIMLRHYSELQKALAPVQEKMPQWRADIRKIVVNYMVDQQMKQHVQQRRAFQNKMKSKEDMMFLLMDPQQPDATMFSPLFQQNKNRFNGF